VATGNFGSPQKTIGVIRDGSEPAGFYFKFLIRGQSVDDRKLRGSKVAERSRDFSALQIL